MSLATRETWDRIARLQKILALVSIASAALLLLIGAYGRSRGYRAPWPYLGFWLLSALTAANAWVLLGAPARVSDYSDAIIRLAVVGFALIAGCGLLLGGVGRLATGPFLALLSVLLVTALAVGRPKSYDPASIASTAPTLHPVFLLGPPVLVFVLSVALAHPPTEYDSLTYHLFFPARWLQAHRMYLVPAPFGDQAPTYAPGNGELFFLWLMLPFHGDLLARAGQFPFYCLAAITIYGLSKRLGAAPSHALYAGGLLLLSRPILEQALGAEVDLVFTAAYLAAVYFGVAAAESGKREDVVLFGLSIGLCVGTKVLGLTYVPLLFPLLLARPVRHQAPWALLGIGVVAAPWYLRNWIITGTPIYPVGITIAGLTLIPGAWTRSVQTQNWAYLTDFRQLPAIVRDGSFGAGLLALWMPLAVLGLWGLVRLRRWRWLGVAVGLPVLIGVIYWVVLPYNGPAAARFLFPAVALLMLLVPPAFRAHPALTRWLPAAVALGMLWVLGMGEEPLVPSGYLALFALLAAASLCCWIFLPGRTFVFALSFLTIAAGVVLAASERCVETGCPVLNVRWSDRPATFESWTWVVEHLSNVDIAYSGNNVPYRLLGPTFENRAYYVNVDRHLNWRYHDYEHALRTGPHFTPPVRPNLPYFRDHPVFDDWLRNLKQTKTRYLFISRLPPVLLAEQDYARDEEGFPVETSWADGHADIFTLEFKNRDVRIYSVRP